MSHPPKNPPSQTDKFKDLARQLEADEDEARFEEVVRKIAPKLPEADDKDASAS